MKYINEKYYEKLLVIEHYKKHPQMRPFIGKSWGRTGKMLVIGESHYLNDYDEKTSRRGNKITWKNWYKMNKEELTQDQERWTSTALQINEAITKNKYEPAWGIWKNVKDAILETGYNPYPKNTSKILCYIAFMNFFQRPALDSGESIIYSNEDIKIANETLYNVANIIKADYLFFVSSKAWENYENELLTEIIVGHSCHPNCKWWNMETKKYTKSNRKKRITGKESFKYFVKKNGIYE